MSATAAKDDDIVHILNGDALLNSFPATIPGTRIVVSEALAEGPINGDTPKIVLERRAEYFLHTYGMAIERYHENTRVAFDSLSDLPKDSPVYLWFEDDVFCQLNCWFTVYFLVTVAHSGPCFAVRPPRHTPYSFATISPQDLVWCYQQEKCALDKQRIASLWKALSSGEVDIAKYLAEGLPNDFAFVHQALLAYLEAIPDNTSPGRPKTALLQIVADLKTDDFTPVFREFSRREPIYGYGDLQVNRLLQELKAAGQI